MANNSNIDDDLAGKVTLFLVSIGAGVLAAVYFPIGEPPTSALPQPPGVELMRRVLVGLAAALANPFVARAATAISESLHRSSFPATFSPWELSVRIWAGALWPVTLGFWMVIAPFFASLNRLFVR